MTLISSVSICFGAADMKDNSFGVRSEAVTPFNSWKDIAQAVVVQPDGKIIAAGYSEKEVNFSSQLDFALARYKQDGTLDDSFGSGGKVLTPFGYVNSNYNSTIISGLALQADGKIIAAGVSFYDGFILVRYNANGSIDASFGSNGKVITRSDDFNGSARAVTVQSDGKIIAAGSAGTLTDPNGRTALVRYNPDGSLDDSFGINGKVVTLVGYGSVANSIVVQPDAKIVVGGYYSRQANSNVTDSVVIRFNSNGSLDSSFGVNGKVVDIFGFSENILYGVALQSDGKIVAGGSLTTATSFPDERTYPVLARLNDSGSLDQGFGNNGTVRAADYFSSYNYAVFVQSNGKIVAVGSASSTSVQVLRYNSNGTPDESFGVFGRALGRFSSTAYAAALQPDGKIITAGMKSVGYTQSGVNTEFVVTRFLGSEGRSLAKYDFDGDGKSDISVYRPSEGVWYLNQSSGGMNAVRFGAATDKPVPADFDGDGKTDAAVYRSGIWYLLRSQAGFAAIPFGDASDIPLTNDFDDDGKAELTVFRPSNGTWYQLNLSTNEFTAYQFGQSGDKPFIYEPDLINKPLFGIYRNGKWILPIPGGFEINFGAADDIPVPADYNGDGRTDLAVFRPSNGIWYFNQSGGSRQVAFGYGSDLPVPADYDGDGKTDISVYRNGIWYLNRSIYGLAGINFGGSTDKPIAGFLVH